VVYGPGDMLGFVEYFLERPFTREVIVEEDVTGRKYGEDDIGNEEIFKKVLEYALKKLNVSIASVPNRKVVKELEDTAHVDALLEISSMDEAPPETFNAIEDMMTLKRLPSLPEDEETAYDFVEKFEKEIDILQYILYRIAFVKKYPESEHSQRFLLEVIDTYLDELDDRFGAKYAMMLFLLFYPDSPKVKDVLLKLIKILRQSKNPEWFEYYERLVMLFPEAEVRLDEIT